jgi:hypothetical protein
MTRPGRAVLLALLVLLAARALAAERWFRSDEMGLAIEPIPAFRLDEFLWVLGVERTPRAGGWVEIRRLLSDGKEQRRWTLVRSADGTTEEREARGGVLVARRLSAADGQLQQEERYAAGARTSRSVYEYASGRLVRVRTFAADGTLSSTADYLTAPSGRLREVRWTNADGSVRTAGQSAGGTGSMAGATAVAEERTKEGDAGWTTRYDEAGRAIDREQRGPAGPAFRERIVYEGSSGAPAATEREWPAEQKAIEATYDASGAVVSQVTRVASMVTERIAWTRDEAGRVLVMRRTGTGGTREVRFTWAADGRLEREEQFVRGARERNVIYPAPGERVEELFENGELFLRVTYRGDERVREEVILDGKVVRERTFAP